MARSTRKQLERFHGVQNPEAIRFAWPHLASNDRFIRWAARIAIEHQPLESWLPKALSEPSAETQVEAILGAARLGGVCPSLRDESSPAVDLTLREKLLKSLEKIDWLKLPADRQLTYVRTLEIIFNRFGRPDDVTVNRFIAKLDPAFPSKSFDLNWLLCETLVYLQSPTVADKTIALINRSPSQDHCSHRSPVRRAAG